MSSSIPSTELFFPPKFYLFIYGCAGLLLLVGFSLIEVSGGYLLAALCGWASLYGGSSCSEAGTLGARFSNCSRCGSQALEQFQYLWCMGLVAPQHVESSWIRDWAVSPALAVRSFTTETTGKPQQNSKDSSLDKSYTWRAAVHRVTKSWTQLSNWTELINHIVPQILLLYSIPLHGYNTFFFSYSTLLEQLSCFQFFNFRNNTAIFLCMSLGGHIWISLRYYAHMELQSHEKCIYSTLSDPMDCSPPGSSIHGIVQAKVLEWVAIAFSLQDNAWLFSKSNSLIMSGFFFFFFLHLSQYFQIFITHEKENGILLCFYFVFLD